MADVHVIFPPQGGVLLTHERLPVMQKDTIFWHVHSGNKKVKSVRIKFDKGRSRFFPEIKGKKTAKPNVMEKTITYLSGTAAKGLQLAGSASMWGTAPTFRKGARRFDKYSIYGLDKKGKVIEELDPEIITDRPTKP